MTCSVIKLTFFALRSAKTQMEECKNETQGSL